LQVTHDGWAQETLNFHGNPPTTPLRCDRRTFGGDIDVQILASVRKGQRIVRDRPAVRRQGANDRVVIDVLGRHRHSSVSVMSAPRTSSIAISPPAYSSSLPHARVSPPGYNTPPARRLRNASTSGRHAASSSRQSLPAFNPSSVVLCASSTP